MNIHHMSSKEKVHRNSVDFNKMNIYREDHHNQINLIVMVVVLSRLVTKTIQECSR
jgi:hypothetical protein